MKSNLFKYKKKGGANMQDYIEARVLEVANYIINTEATIRQTAKKFGVSKSTIYNDVTKSLPNIDMRLATEVNSILMYNKSVRHIRGGKATKELYKGC